MRRDGIQQRMPSQREITVAPDRFEVAADDAILITELHSAMRNFATLPSELAYGRDPAPQAA